MLYQVKQEEPVTKKDMEVMKELFRIHLLAEQRVGTTPETRIMWLLDFAQRKLDQLSPGDWVNLCDEIIVYGAPFRTGYRLSEAPEGRTVDEVRQASQVPRGKIKKLQSELLRMLRDILEGVHIVTTRFNIRLGGINAPGKSQFGLAWFGDSLHLLTLRLLQDMTQIDMKRMRRCERGKQRGGKALEITPCERLFFAHDLRQRFCSSECGKEDRWAWYWDANRDKINKKRRTRG